MLEGGRIYEEELKNALRRAGYRQVRVYRCGKVIAEFDATKEMKVQLITLSVSEILIRELKQIPHSARNIVKSESYLGGG